MNIHFDELTPDKNFAFIDVTSIKNLIDDLDFLTAPINRRTSSAMKQRLNQNAGTQIAMAIIERLVAYESIVVDETGVRSMRIRDLPDEIPFLETTSIPASIYRATAEMVHDLGSAGLYRDIERQSSQFNIRSPYESYFDELWKKCCDRKLPLTSSSEK